MNLPVLRSGMAGFYIYFMPFPILEKLFVFSPLTFWGFILCELGGGVALYSEYTESILRYEGEVSK